MKVFSYIIYRQEIWLKFKNGILFFYTIYKNGKIKKGHNRQFECNNDRSANRQIRRSAIVGR